MLNPPPVEKTTDALRDILARAALPMDTRSLVDAVLARGIYISYSGGKTGLTGQINTLTTTLLYLESRHEIAKDKRGNKNVWRWIGTAPARSTPYVDAPPPDYAVRVQFLMPKEEATIIAAALGQLGEIMADGIAIHLRTLRDGFLTALERAA